MKADIMKVVFSCIGNGINEDLPANGVKLSDLESVINKKDDYSSNKKANQANKAKSSQAIFESLVTASNCANPQMEKLFNGYVTVTSEHIFFRKYH